MQVTAVIGAVGACVAYMLAEGLADGANKESGEIADSGDKTE
ncbi:hypothetical protein [Fontibacillus sp. BL9]